MRMFGWFTSQRAKTRLSSLAQIVAEQCRESVWRHVASRAGALQSVDEARGYVRSRARAIVRRKTELITLLRPLPEPVERFIWQTALDLVVRQLAPHLVARTMDKMTLKQAA
jgi:hypothetical protein